MVSKVSAILNGFNCGQGSVSLKAFGSAGTTEYRWYTTQTGGTYTATPTSSWNTPSISTTTIYYVTAYNGTCESLYRTPIFIIALFLYPSIQIIDLYGFMA